MKTWPIPILILTLLVTSCAHDPEVPLTPVLTFETDVKPIIVNGCARAGCHDGTGEDPTLKNYGQVMSQVTAGEPTKSKLYKVMTKLWGGSAMPPDGPLSNDQVRTVYVWILQGAKEK